jgi:hypothetical protein
MTRSVTGRLAAWIVSCALVASASLAAPGPLVAEGATLRMPVHPSPIGVLPSDLVEVARHAGRSTAPVELSIDVGTAADRVRIEALVQRLGGEVRRAGTRSVEARVPATALATIGTARGVDRVTSMDRPFAWASSSRVAATIDANAWEEAGIGGAGVKIGVLDDFEGIDELLGTTVTNRVHFWCSADWGTSVGTSLDACTDEWADEHGSAVVETLASVAPQAELYLASPWSYLDAQEAIDWFAAEGVRIVSSSMASGRIFEGRGDGLPPEGSDGTWYGLVDRAVTHGMLWVNAAGNENDGVYAAPFTAGTGNGVLHDFAPGVETDAFYMEEGWSAIVALRWEDSWTQPVTDLDLVVYGPDGVFPVADSSDTNAKTGVPLESLYFTAEESGWYGVAVMRWNGPPAPFELQATERLRIRTDSPSLPSPADSANPGMLSVGAVRVDSPDFVEPFSSHGPTLDGRVKPDVVAPDCGETTTYGPFCGTSQSAPVAAGAAALLVAADPTLAGDPAALADAMRARGAPVVMAEPREVGAGLVRLGTPPADVPAPPLPAVDMSLAVKPATVTYGAPVAALVTTPGGAGRDVSIERWQAGHWLTVATGTTGANGAARVTWRPTSPGLVRAVLASTADAAGGESDPTAVSVKARLVVTRRPSSTVVPAGTEVRYTVTVVPYVKDATRVNATVSVRFHGTWRTVDSPSVGEPDAAGRWTFWIPWTRGDWALDIGASGGGVEAAYAPTIVVSAR